MQKVHTDDLHPNAQAIPTASDEVVGQDRRLLETHGERAEAHAE
jgi:hypothetical protein